tara:strand:+ start:970 stop:1686 length:717 start_codon:yes stop_codon:yes gene_type:complete
MALPKLNVPKYTLKLPSDARRIVNYRPFLVKEEKLLLIATETGEQADIVKAIKDIITACTDISDVNELSTFDIEFVFLQIRTKSVGENVTVSITCPDDGETQVEVEIPLDDIKVIKDKKHKKELQLSDDVIITMGYPSLDTFVKMNFTAEGGAGVEQVFDMAASCVETITDPNQVYDCRDLPRKDLLEFFDNLNSKQFGVIQGFFESMPKLSHTVKVTNPETKVESDVVLEGLASFFG